MSPTNVEKLAPFAQGALRALPPRKVLTETKRILLDALEGDLAATSSEYGRAGVNSAWGKTFVGGTFLPQSQYISDRTTYTTTEELAIKFRDNAEGVLTAGATDAIINTITSLEQVEDLSTLGTLLRPEGAAK